MNGKLLFAFALVCLCVCLSQGRPGSRPRPRPGPGHGPKPGSRPKPGHQVHGQLNKEFNEILDEIMKDIRDGEANAETTLEEGLVRLEALSAKIATALEAAVANNSPGLIRKLTQLKDEVDAATASLDALNVESGIGDIENTIIAAIELIKDTFNLDLEAIVAGLEGTLASMRASLEAAAQDPGFANMLSNVEGLIAEGRSRIAEIDNVALAAIDQARVPASAFCLNLGPNSNLGLPFEGLDSAVVNALMKICQRLGLDTLASVDPVNLVVL